MTKKVTGRIEPMRFDGKGLNRAVNAIVQGASAVEIDAPSVTRAEAENMANAAQRLWDLIRASDTLRLERIRQLDTEYGDALFGIRDAMR